MPGLKRLALGGFVLTSAVAINATAFDPLPTQWTDKSREFKVNLSSFTTNLSDMSFTTTEAKYWISLAMQTWRQRAVGDISLVYQGTTPKIFDSDCLDQNGNQTNEIYMHPGCYNNDPLCAEHGVSARWPSGSTTIEDDVCFFDDAPPVAWRIKTSDFVQGSQFSDLASTMTHELGHFFGLDHTAGNVVMRSGTISENEGTMLRLPLGDDMTGITSSSLPYGGSAKPIFFRSISTAGWSAETQLVTASVMPGFTLAKRDASNFGVILAMGFDGIFFFRMNYPLGANPASTFKSYTGAGFSTRRPVGIAGRTVGSNLHVAAWTQTKADLVCHPIRVGFSSNNFDTITTVDLSADCTVHDPAVVYDPTSNRFILFYVQQAFTAGNRHLNDLIRYRTSTDGQTWTSAQLLGSSIKTIDAVTAACSGPQGECMLTYTPGDSELPVSKLSSFTVSSAGLITVTGSTTPATYGNNCRHWANPAGVYRRNGQSVWFVSTSSSSQSGSCDFGDDGIVAYHEVNNVMVNPTSLVVPDNVRTRHRPVFAMADTTATTTGYILYAKE